MPNFTHGLSCLMRPAIDSTKVSTLWRRHSAMSANPAPCAAKVAASGIVAPATGYGIEVVVEVHAVEVVVLDRVQDGLLDVLLHLGESRVEVELAAVGPDPVGVHAGRVLGHELRRVGLHRDAVRVEPGVQFEVAPVRLVDDEGERVVARVLALHAGEVLRPRLERARPEGVGGRPHLHEDGVEVELLGHVEPVQELGLLLCGGEPGARRPVDVHDRRDPHGAQFALAGRRRRARTVGRPVGGERRAGRERADGDGERRSAHPRHGEGQESAPIEVGAGESGLRCGVGGHRRASGRRVRFGRYFHTRALV